MNIVELIKDQIGGDLLGKLGSSMGVDEAAAKTATGVAVPSLLSILAQVATTGQGADKLLGYLQNFGADSLNTLKTDMSSGQGGKIESQGGDILGSLLGGGNLTTLLALLSKFSGLGVGAMKTLMSYLAPMILSVIASQLKSKAGGLSLDSLTKLFAEQKGNIAGAMPAGLSLASLMPGGVPPTGQPTQPKPAVEPSTPSAPPQGELAPGLPGWLLPAIAIAFLLGLGYYFLFNSPAINPNDVTQTDRKIPGEDKPPVPETLPGAAVPGDMSMPSVDDVTKSLTGLYTSAAQHLTSIKDEATAEAALPGLKEVDAKADAVRVLWDKLPDVAKASIKQATASSFGSFKDMATKVLEIPGVGDKLKTLLDAILAKLTAMSA